MREGERGDEVHHSWWKVAPPAPINLILKQCVVPQWHSPGTG